MTRVIYIDVYTIVRQIKGRLVWLTYVNGERGRGIHCYTCTTMHTLLYTGVQH